VPSSIINIIKNIKDSHSGQAILYTTDGGQIYLDCVYKEGKSPDFLLAFPPDKIPSNLDFSKNCSVSLKGAEPPLVITATIKEQIGDRILSLHANQAVDPVSLREYFRVDLNTRVVARFEPTHENSDQTSWEIHGETLDVSGTGFLCLLDHEPPNHNNISLEVYFDHFKHSISCQVRVIRIRRLKQDRFRVAFHIEKIQSKDRDKIITCCMNEQRKMLRERMDF